MDHVAYMSAIGGSAFGGKKTININWISKILSGEKKIELRWYRTKHLPWGKIKTGDRIFLKNTGELVTVKSRVKRVLALENLTPEKVREILEKYGRDDGIAKEKMEYFYELFSDKKYCLLIFLTRVEKVKPFGVDKSGFGQMAAWITVEDIDIIKRNPAGAGR